MYEFTFVMTSLFYLTITFLNEHEMLNKYFQDPYFLSLFKVLPIYVLMFFSLNSKVPKERITYKHLVTLGLLLSSFGDLALQLPNFSFIYGLAFFLIAHLFYIAAFGASFSHIFHGVPFFALGFYVYFFYMKPALPENLVVPVAVYIIVIITMAWRATARFQNGRVDTLYGCAGATFFVVSDLILGINRFVQPLPYAHLLTMIFYYYGQFGISLSSVYINPYIHKENKRK
mgnify:CR=1 FL=1